MSKTVIKLVSFLKGLIKMSTGRIGKTILFFLSLGVYSDVFAGIFDIVPTDRSLYYLGQIFGGSVGAVTLGGGANPLLSNMFERFNFIIVTLGVAILSYIGIASAINTAREGEAMGKKFSLWVPLRAMLGMLFMVPTPGTGYSVVQMTVMWFVLNGIGAANAIWNVVLDQMSQGIQAIGVLQLPASASDQLIASTVVNNVLGAATCMQVLNTLPNLDLIRNYGSVQTNTVYQTMVTSPAGPNPTSISQTAVINIGVVGNNAPASLNNICGSFTVTTSIAQGDPNNAFNQASLSTRLTYKINAVKAMLDAVQPAAQMMAITQLAGGIAPPQPNTGYVDIAVSAYKGQAINLITGVRAALPTASSGTLSWEQGPPPALTGNAAINAVRQVGWIHAGSYYFNMVGASTAAIDADAGILPVASQVPTPLMPYNAAPPGAPATWNANLYPQLSSNNSNLVAMNQALGNAGTYWGGGALTPQTSLPGLGSGNVPSVGNAVADAITSNLASLIRTPIIAMFQSSLTGNGGDPLQNMMMFGTNIIAGVEAGFFMLIAVTFAVLILTAVFNACSSAATTFMTIMVQITLVGSAVLIFFWTMGATMGIYLPLVPYLIFTTTAVGWFLAVVEALVGAPIIALALVQPGGEELGGIKQALLILANVFLRPSLMIFGFVIAGSLLRATISLINYGFESSIQPIPPTLTGIMPILAIYVALISSLVNQSFGLIYELPNKVLRYMGGSPESFSPEKQLGEAKQGFDKGAGESQKALDKGKEKIGEKGMSAAGGKFTGDARAETERKRIEDTYGKSPGGAGGTASGTPAGGAPGGGGAAPGGGGGGAAAPGGGAPPIPPRPGGGIR